MAQQLFDGSDSEIDDIPKIKIDEEYARRFEHNKRREDLHRFEELKKKGVIESASASEDDDSESSDDDEIEGGLNSGRSDKEFFDALVKVKKKDPVLKQKDVKLFSDHSSEGESVDNKISKLKDAKDEKPMYLKDVTAQHLIEEGPEFGDEEEEINEKKKGKSEISKDKKAMHLKDKKTNHLVLEGSKFDNEDGKRTYREEQEELKRAFQEAVEKEGLELGEEDFFTVKEKADEEKVESGDKEYEEKLNEYFGGEVELDENSRFIRNYFMNKMWIDKNGEKSNVGEEELQELSEDEMLIDQQAEYESRFQENPGDRVLGHARKVEGSVRKKTNTRKEQRKSKEERMAIAQRERDEELKHLKNLKKQEIQEKVKKIMKTAGIDDNDIIPLSAAELEEEFDPEEYDRMMKKAFDEKYYNAEDANPDFCSDDDMEKPDFEKEDEQIGLPKGWDASGSEDEFSTAREKALKEKIEDNSDDDIMESEDEKEEKVPKEGTRKRKHKTALLEKARQAMMDEYYKLDYEDTIGDLKTRFNYAKTKPQRFGMHASEILVMDDNELNQYVPLKKLAPFREDEFKLSKQKRYMLKMKAAEELQRISRLHKKNKKVKVDSGKLTSSNGIAEKEKATTEESNIDKDSKSRNARRRQKKAENKLPESRLIAYGKIPSKSKRGGKH